MKVLFCCYRDWALRVWPTVRDHPRVIDVRMANDPTHMRYLLVKERWPDIVLLCGWSDPPTKEMVDTGIPIFSEHPATSDRYTPGSPLQNQILDGMLTTKHRLVRVGFPELSLRQWSHEVDMSLEGNMSDVLGQMTVTARELFTMFLNDYPNVEWKTWPALDERAMVPRRTPEMSRLSTHDLAIWSTRALYDRIRCLEDPYPNAFIEDSYGKLYFKLVRYEAK
jgi:hypothetical protein